MYRVMKQYLLKNDDVRKPISVTTDGAPSMVGRTAGLVVLLKADEDFPNIHSYHCIIHQEALCAKMKDNTLNSVLKVAVKTVNCIRANALYHRQFKMLLEDCDSNYSDLILHADVSGSARAEP